jgi:hypothetical protein
MVYLRVSPMEGVHRFGVKGKLSPRYTGSFKILSQSRGVAFELELPKELSKVHNVFHASQLQKCMKTPEETISYDEIELQADLTYVEEPSRILAENWKQLRNSHQVLQGTMEASPGKRSYLGKGRGIENSLSRFLQVHLTPNFGTKFILRREVCNIPKRRTTPG